MDQLNPSDADQAAALRLAWRTYAETVRALLGCGGLNLAGAEHVRRNLRAGTWAHEVPEPFKTDRVLLLDEVTRVVAEARDLVDYYRGAGDLLPEIPDDVAGLL